MDPTTKSAIMILATGVVIAGLYYFRDAIVQFALALLLFVGIQGLARWLDQRIPFMPRWLASILAFVVVLALVGWLGWFIAENIGAFTTQAGAYEARLNAIVRQLFQAVGAPGQPPTVAGLLSNANAGQILSEIAGGLRGVASDTIFILIYLGFIFAAASSFPDKLDRIFPRPAARAHAQAVVEAVRTSMETYLWVTTLLGVMTSVVIYFALLWVGLENPLFWSVLIFFLSFIPTIGPLIGTLLPTLFALVQFPDLAGPGLVLAAVGLSQFVVGNFIQPRITGDSLNLSALVILLALAVWGVLWGIAGAFLATPLTVLLMTLFAQFPSTRWIAVLLSANGDPGESLAKDRVASEAGQKMSKVS